MKENCLFCKIIDNQIPSFVAYENNQFKVILDKFPGNKGHTLILTKEHFDDIYQMDSDTAGKLFALATVVARALKEKLDCQGLNLLQNNGEVAGQTVPHFHLHLIPRYTDDGMTIPWKTKEFTNQEMQELAEGIRRYI